MLIIVFTDLGTTCQLIFVSVSLRSNVGVEMMAKFNAITVSKCNCKSSLCVTDGWGFPGGSAVKNPPANAGHTGSIPGPGRSPAVGNSNPLQCSCLENSTNRGTWWATVHGVAKRRTQLCGWAHSHLALIPFTGFFLPRNLFTTTSHMLLCSSGLSVAGQDTNYLSE